jgi:aspartyl-tRNA(Asn)/glutamyl-tRNA(Gln) amidotransferase subunit B
MASFKTEDLEAIIGLEIHAQISTKTKMFSSDSADYFSKEANINVSPVSMGFPGQLPVLNQEGVRKGVKAALALNCKINNYSHFDRKNYFYPDSPKGYQISQFEYPVSEKGFLEIKVGEEKKKVRITRLHLEEDAGKLTHFQGGTLIDFNRCGVGLMEIVSEPDLRSAAEAVAYAKAIQMILRYAGASDADMEKGMMRFDASVSLRVKGTEKLNARAEIKNLNSFRSLETAINFEIKRQKELWEKDEVPTGDITVGYDDISGKTYFMRSKEGSQDYRYFPEPDLPPLVLENDFIDQLRAELPEMPEQKYQRYVGELGLAEAEALFLVEDRDLNVFFDKVVEISGDSKKAASFVLSILVGRMKKDGRSFAEIKVEAEALAKLIKMVNDGGLSMNIAKGEVFEEMYLNGGDPEKIVEAKGLKSMSNEGELEEICQKVVAGNAKIVEDFKGGKDNAFKALMGLVMKETRGQANPVLVNKILNNLLQK